MNENNNLDQQQFDSEQAQEEWVRERLVIRLYEPLPENEEAAVNAYLEEHPELCEVQEQYEAIVQGLGNCGKPDIPLSDGEIQALKNGMILNQKQANRQHRKKIMYWLTGSAAAACLLALLWTQGVSIQIGSTRLAIGKMPEAAALDEQRLRGEITEEMATVMAPYIAQLMNESEAQGKQIQALYELVNQQRIEDRRELRNTFQELVKRARLDAPMYVYSSSPPDAWEGIKEPAQGETVSKDY